MFDTFLLIQILFNNIQNVLQGYVLCFDTSQGRTRLLREKYLGESLDSEKKKSIFLTHLETQNRGLNRFHLEEREYG